MDTTLHTQLATIADHLDETRPADPITEDDVLALTGDGPGYTDLVSWLPTTAGKTRAEYASRLREIAGGR